VSAEAAPWVGDQASGLRALRDLRAARRRRYAEQVDWMESLYRLYLGVIFGGLGLALVSGALADVRVDRHAVLEIQRHGAAVLGLLVAVAVAGGLRSGARGGPLVLEAADVQHVLLAPIDRGAALRRLAVRRLRSAALVGLVAGLIAGNFAFRRLPGPTAQWLFFAGVFGAAVAIWALAAALIASGRRMHRTAAWLVGVLIIGWSIADIARGWVSSPASMLGQLALWPMHSASDSLGLPAAGLGIAALAAVLGLAGLGGISLDAARRRAGLVAQLRFAVTTQDLRAIILLRRQLASELPRRHPWLRVGSSDGSRGAVWMRDWRSFLRWPLVRVARVFVLGAVAGLSLLGAWRGTTPLVLVASLAVMVAAFDAVEPIGQEVDHPTRLALLPVGAREVIRRHLLAPEVLMGGVLLIAVGAAIAAGAPAELVGVLVVMLLPTAVLSLYCAALSVTNDPFAYVLSPAMGYLQTGVPVALLIIAVSGPVILARAAARHGTSAIAASVPSELVVLLICWGLNSWLGHRIASRVPS
jgi:hypothetical protein